MSKIQQQVIFHVKKSSQNFSLDYALNRLGFFKFRRYNLRDNFLRICSNNRKRVRFQLGTLLQRKYKDSHSFSLALKSYSAFFLTYMTKYFKIGVYKLYDINVFSYVYFLNRLFFHLNSFLINFSFYSFTGLVNLNFFFNILHALYPGVLYKNLIYRLWFQTFFTNFKHCSQDIKTKLVTDRFYFFTATRLFSKCFVKFFSSRELIIQKFMPKFRYLFGKTNILVKSYHRSSFNSSFLFKRVKLSGIIINRLQ